MTVEEQLSKMGHTLPEAPKPVASYVPFTRSGNIVYVSGQIPTRQGEVLYKGKLGKEVTLEQGQEAARLCALNCLAQVKAAAGSLDKVKRILKVTGFVAAAEGFTEIPKVVNGASDLLGQAFGEKGKHARAAVGAAELPLGVPVEIEMIVEIG